MNSSFDQIDILFRIQKDIPFLKQSITRNRSFYQGSLTAKMKNSKVNKKRQQCEGLPNVASTCFLNAIIQSLYASDSFVQNIRKLQTNNKIIHYLRKILLAISNFSPLDDKIQIMRKLSSQLAQSIEDYELNQEQDALKFLTQIYSHAKEAFPSDLFLLSYQKLCQNHAQNPIHWDERISNYSKELFMDACPEVCLPCSEKQRKLIKKISYLIKMPQNLMTIGQDFISELSPYKLKVERVYFYILYFNEELLQKGKTLEDCFSVVRYNLKARTLYKGDLVTGHYIAIRNRIQTQIQGFHELQVNKKSLEFYKFDDLNVTLIDESQFVEKNAYYRTKFTIYQKNGQPIPIKDFIQQHEKSLKDHPETTPRDKEHISQIQKRKNIKNIIDIYRLIISLKSKQISKLEIRPQCKKPNQTQSPSFSPPISNSNQTADVLLNFSDDSSNQQSELTRSTKLVNEAKPLIHQSPRKKENQNKNNFKQQESTRINKNNSQSPSKYNRNQKKDKTSLDDDNESKCWKCFISCRLIFLQCLWIKTNRQKKMTNQVYRPSFGYGNHKISPQKNFDQHKNIQNKPLETILIPEKNFQMNHQIILKTTNLSKQSPKQLDQSKTQKKRQLKQNVEEDQIIHMVEEEDIPSKSVKQEKECKSNSIKSVKQLREQNLTLANIFQFVKQKGFIVFYRVPFKYLYDAIKDRPQRQKFKDYPQDSYVKLGHHQIQKDTNYYYSLTYKNLPMKLSNDWPEVKLISDRSQLKTVLYDKFVQLNQKKQSSANLRSNEELEKEWQKLSSVLTLTNQQIPAEIRNYYVRYGEDYKNKQAQKMSEIYMKLALELIKKLQKTF